MSNTHERHPEVPGGHRERAARAARAHRESDSWVGRASARQQRRAEARPYNVDQLLTQFIGALRNADVRISTAETLDAIGHGGAGRLQRPSPAQGQPGAGAAEDAGRESRVRYLLRPVLLFRRPCYRCRRRECSRRRRCRTATPPARPATVKPALAATRKTSAPATRARTLLGNRTPQLATDERRPTRDCAGQRRDVGAAIGARPTARARQPDGDHDRDRQPPADRSTCTRSRCSRRRACTRAGSWMRWASPSCSRRSRGWRTAPPLPIDGAPWTSRIGATGCANACATTSSISSCCTPT